MTKSTKKKLIAIGICFVILVASILSNTIAYFTDDEKVINTFTSGNVEITLDEAKVEKDTVGNLVAKGSERFVPTTTDFTQDYGTIYPGMKITKDPTITNEGSESAYIAAKIVISNTNDEDLTSLLTGSNDAIFSNTATTVVTNEADINAAINDSNCKYIVYKVNDSTTNTLYVFVKAPVDAGKKVVLFDTVTIPADWDNNKKDLVDDLQIDVTGYGIQTYGFANGYAAATTAFDSAF